jgi:hypothetical protein
MGFKTDRMSAQDKALNGFRKAIQSSGSMAPNKPLTLAEQLAQLNSNQTPKYVGGVDEMELKMNEDSVVKVRATKK